LGHNSLTNGGSEGGLPLVSWRC